jgi:hypothetical protein
MSLERSLRSHIAIAMICLMVLGPILGTLPSGALRIGKATDIKFADWSFVGEGPWNMFGAYTIIVHDVNGDGFDDLLTAATENNNSGGDRSGKVYLFFGSASGWAKGTVASSASASFIGEEAGTGVDFKVAYAGDVNGDGLGDIMVGVYRRANTDGKVYLFFGKTTGWGQNVSFANADASFVGSSQQCLGMSVASAGDINGDGYDDLVIGSSSKEYDLSYQGAVYIVLGRSTGWATNVPIENFAAGSFVGEHLYDQLGYAVSSAGDVNGDGLDDFLAGAWKNDDVANEAGKSYLFFGRTSGWSMNENATFANASFRGERALSHSGTALQGGGDINDDGLSDFLVGASDDNENGTNAGQLYLMLGRKTGWAPNMDLGSSNASFVGYTNQHIGFSMDMKGDVTGDGVDDLVIGSPLDSPSNATGRTYVFPGKKAGWALGTNLGTAPYSLVGESTYSYSAFSVSDAGDVNNDGIDDLFVGALYDSHNGQFSGKAFLFITEKNLGPSSVTSLKTYSKPAYTNQTRIAPIGQTVYLELKGTDADPAKANIAKVHVVSNWTSPALDLRLYETGLATGTYRGTLKALNRTDPSCRCIGASPDSIINVSAISVPSVYQILFTTAPVVLSPTTDVTGATEDQNYLVKYTNTGKAVDLLWNFETNASWLHWSDLNSTLYGTPDNSQVGIYNVTVGAQENFAFLDQHVFNITVKNALPKILTTNVLFGEQGKEYSVDYQSDDEGQGNFAWTLATNASWLHINSTSGVLNGTPGPNNITTYWCNVSFTDGNGGLVYSRFNLTVKNVNDRPIIITPDVLTAIEDVPYSVTYTASDPDPGDSQLWIVTTNSTWLNFNTTNRTLWGTPKDSDVGQWAVKILVKDSASAQDYRSFIITVQNVNDRPFFSPVMDTTATVLDIFHIKASAKDVDIGDILKYSIKSGPDNMTIDPGDGNITWVPWKLQRGLQSVIVEVSDGKLSATTSFNVTVVVPRPKLLMPANGTTVNSLVADLRWSLDLNSSLLLSYRIFMGEGAALPELFVSDDTAKNATILGKLKDKTTYRWYIIPTAHAPGKNNIVHGDPSEIWRFTVDIPKPFVTVELLNTVSSITRGKTIQVWVTVFNKGNTDGNVTLTIESDLPSAAFSIIDTIDLDAGTSKRISLNISVPDNAAVRKHQVTVKATLGNYTGSGSIDLNIKGKPNSNLFSGQLLILLVLMVVVIAVLIAGVAYMSHRRRRAEAEKATAESEKAQAQSELATVKATADSVEDFNIDEIFLIYNDGRLITHVSYKAAAIDDQIFSSMLVALQGFVKDSFRTEDTLSRFDYGSRKMVLEKGKFLILATALSGTEPSMLKENMHTLIQKLEGLYAGIVENWDGELKQFKDVNLLLSPLFDIKKGLKIRTEKEEVKVKSGIEFFGGYVRLKVAISNELSGPIEDVRLKLAYDNMTLQLSHIDPQYPRDASMVMLGAIPAGE